VDGGCWLGSSEVWTKQLHAAGPVIRGQIRGQVCKCTHAGARSRRAYPLHEAASRCTALFVVAGGLCPANILGGLRNTERLIIANRKSAPGLASSIKSIGEHSQLTLRGTSRRAAHRPSLASVVMT
jgi:hypothetical protein